MAAHEGNRSLEPSHLSGAGLPAPEKFQWAACLRRKALAIKLEIQGSGHCKAFPRKMSAPLSKTAFEPRAYEPEIETLESCFERDIRLSFINLQPHYLQPNRTLAQGHEPERTQAHTHDAGLAMAPIRHHQSTLHIERHPMRRHVEGIVHQWLAWDGNADLKPARGGDEHRYGQFGWRRVEDARHISSRRNDPSGAAGHCTSAAHTEEAVADGEARFGAAFAKRVVALSAKDPSGVPGCFQHVDVPIRLRHDDLRQSRP